MFLQLCAKDLHLAWGLMGLKPAKPVSLYELGDDLNVVRIASNLDQTVGLY